MTSIAEKSKQSAEEDQISNSAITNVKKEIKVEKIDDQEPNGQIYKPIAPTWTKKEEKNDHVQFKIKEEKEDLDEDKLGALYAGDIEDQEVQNKMLDTEIKGEIKSEKALDVKKRRKPMVLNKIHSCDQCPFQSRYTSSLKAHIITMHTDQIFNCEYCTFKTKYRSSLKAHIKTIHTKPLIYKCENCDYESPCPRNFKSHVTRVHIKSYTYFCNECGHVTNCRQNLRIHMKKKHRRRQDLFCMECNFSTNSVHTFKNHMIKKHGENKEEVEAKYQSEEHIRKCNLCDFETPYKSTIDQHYLRKHSTEEKSIKCEFCPYKTYFSFALKRHRIRKHTKEECHPCPICSYKSVDKSDLKSHVLRRHKEYSKQTLPVG